MVEQAKGVLRALKHHWAGRLLWAAMLPLWVMLIASVSHGPPTVSAAFGPVLMVLTIVGGLVGATFGIWGSTAGAKDRMAQWVPPREHLTGVQRAFRLIGNAAFLAACVQVIWQFDLFSGLIKRQYVASADITSWDTLFVLCALQFISFVAEASFGSGERT